MNEPPTHPLLAPLVSFWNRMAEAQAAEVEADRTWVAEQLMALNDPLSPRTPRLQSRPLLNVLVGLADEPGLRQALEHGALPGETDAKGITALHLAAKDDQPGLAQALLEYGACLTAVDNEGKTPLHWAAESTQGNAVDLLVKAGAPLEARTSNGQTPVFVAAAGHPLALEQLLKRGADPNATSQAGDTPLSQALMTQCLDSLERLLEHGCDVNQLEGGNWTPLQLAINRDHRRGFERLLECGAQLAQTLGEPTPLFHMLAIHHRLDWAPLLFQRGVDPEGEDAQGRTVEQYLHQFNETGLLAQWRQLVLDHRLPTAGPGRSNRF